MQLRTPVPPAGSDHCTRTCELPCASGVLPMGTPGGAGGGSGTIGTGLAAVVTAGCAASGVYAVGLAPTANVLRSQTWTPHRWVLVKSRVGTPLVSR